MNDVVEVPAAARVYGSVRVPGDKSASHRAILLSGLAAGRSTIRGISPGEDVAATARIIAQLGAVVRAADEALEIDGPAAGLVAAGEPLDCGNSGTAMRLLCGVVGAVEGEHQLVGDPSLSRRPMDRVARPLGLMGVAVEGEGPTARPPLRVRGRARPLAITYRVPQPSAQVKSAILLCALSGEGPTTVEEAVRTRTATEDMLAECGVAVEISAEGEGRRVTVHPGRPRRHDWLIPGDPSQAAFFAVLGAIHRDASVEVLTLDPAPERVGFVGVLQRMGARVSLHPHDRHTSLTALSGPLVATEVHSWEVPSVDEVPVLTVAAAAAEGVSAFRAMDELRHKESDRFAASIELARALGARAWAEGDDFFVEGLGAASRFEPFAIDAGLDHRLVMAAAVAATAGRGGRVHGASTVATSYPAFFRDLALLR